MGTVVVRATPLGNGTSGNNGTSGVLGLFGSGSWNFLTVTFPPGAGLDRPGQIPNAVPPKSAIVSGGTANQGPAGYVPAGGVPPDDGFLDDYLGTGSKINAVRSVLSWLADNVKITKAARIGEIVNVPLFLSAEVMDYYAWKNNKISGAKALVNLGMGLIGFSKYGAPISLVYFGVDAFYDGGWDGLGKDISNGVSNAWGQLTQGLNQYNSNIYQWVPHQ